MTENRITILPDSFGKPSVLKKEWDFATLIEFNGQRLLCDTGNSARTFAEHTAAMGVDLRHLDFAVISHRHDAHTSGLNHLLRSIPRLPSTRQQRRMACLAPACPGVSIRATTPCPLTCSTMVGRRRGRFTMVAHGPTRSSCRSSR